MKVKYLSSGEDLLFYLYGELDECCSLEVRTAIDDVLNKHNFSKVIFNFSGVTFMDSTGIGMLLGRYKKIKNKNAKTFVQSPSKQIDKIFEISGLYKIMPKI